MRRKRDDVFRVPLPVIVTQIRMSPEAHSVLMQLVDRNKTTIKGQLELLVLEAGRKQGIRP